MCLYTLSTCDCVVSMNVYTFVYFCIGLSIVVYNEDVVDECRRFKYVRVDSLYTKMELNYSFYTHGASSIILRITYVDIHILKHSTWTSE
jgi:hypothetical protein